MNMLMSNLKTEGACPFQMSVSTCKTTRCQDSEVHNVETSAVFTVHAEFVCPSERLCYVLDMRTAEAGFEVNDIPV
jgi:hypothetical protein